MENLYLKIDGSQYNRIFVVGDLHGCFDTLQKEMWAAQFNTETDLLISVGDLIDRGTQNVECLGLLKEPWFKAVLGNHEVMALNALSSEPQSEEGDLAYFNWFRNGGSWIMDIPEEQKPEVLELFTQVASLPGIIEVSVNDKSYVICHADYPSNEYQSNKPIDEDILVWGRERIAQNQNGEGTIINGAHRFYFGHTPAKDPMQFYNQYYIDTGAVFGGRLTMVQIK